MAGRKLHPSHSVRMLAAVDRAFGTLTSRLASAAAASGLPVDIDRFFLLHALSLAPDQRLAASELAELAALPRSTASDVLKHLETSGYIARVRPEHDRRQTHAVLTASGLALVNKWTPAMLEVAINHTSDILATGHLRATIDVANAINTNDDLSAFVTAYLTHLNDSDLDEGDSHG